MKMRPAYTEIEDFSQIQRLADEKELLHMYVTDHPIKQYRRKLSLQNVITIQRVKQMDINRQVKTAVIMQNIKKIHTRRGDSMAFVTVADETDEIEGVVFPALYRQINPWLQEEEIVCIVGKVSERQNKKQLIIDQITACNLEELTKVQGGNVYIRVSETNKEDALPYIHSVVKNYPGSSAIIIHDEKEKKTYKLAEKYTLRPEAHAIDELKRYFGDKNVVLK